MTRYCRYKGIACEFATEYGYCKVTGCVKRNGDRAVNGLYKLPTVDAVPVRRGRWIIKDNPGTGWYRVTCSECGEDVTSVAPVIGFFPKAKITWDFCPNCGAKMDGKDGDNHEG